MGFDRHFTLGLALRLCGVALAMAALLWSGWHAHLIATSIIAAALLIAALASLWTYIRHTNAELARFVAALMHGDLSQGFSTGRRGGGFEELGRQLDGAIRKLRQERAEANEAGRFNAALVDEAPIALLIVDEERVELANRAARKLFHITSATRIEDYEEQGAGFVAALRGEGRRIGTILLDGRPQRAVMTSTAIHRLGKPLRLLAVQPLQGELDAVEMAAQADLVRVLTHEIMNSMTPVTSLAHSAVSLVADADDGSPAMADARAAIETVARRAEGIMHFVEGYRSFIRAPTIRPRRFAARPWAEEMARLFAATEAGAEAELIVAVTPGDLMLDADPDLMAQAALNLMKNGAEAASAIGKRPRVALDFALVAGGKVSIAVSDNGPGIAPDHMGDIFLPFFTTKAKGTGVGLSLVRRIVTAHRGTIAVRQRGEGACIEMLL